MLSERETQQGRSPRGPRLRVKFRFRFSAAVDGHAGRRGLSAYDERVFARLHSLATTPEQYDVGLELVRDELLPWARESSGYRGLIGLVDRSSGKALVLTLWADEASLEGGAETGDRLSALAADASGATRTALESFEVSLFDVP